MNASKSGHASGIYTPHTKPRLFTRQRRCVGGCEPHGQGMPPRIHKTTVALPRTMWGLVAGAGVMCVVGVGGRLP